MYLPSKCAKAGVAEGGGVGVWGRVTKFLFKPFYLPTKFLENLNHRLFIEVKRLSLKDMRNKSKHYAKTSKNNIDNFFEVKSLPYKKGPQ